MKNLLTILDNKMTISHRIVAENTANNEKSIRNILTKYIEDFELFGRLHFKNAVEKKLNQGGLKPKTYYLNEQQAYLLLTYLRNSELVRNFKVALIKAFFEMREKLYQKDSQNFNGKSIVHTINGLKSGLASKDRAINQLEVRIQSQATQIEKLKVENIKFYQEWKDSTSTLNKLKSALGVEELNLEPKEHNNLLEMLYQVKAYKDDMQTMMNTLSVRCSHIDNMLKLFENNYPKCSGYIGELNNRSIGALKSQY